MHGGRRLPNFEAGSLHDAFFDAAEPEEMALYHASRRARKLAGDVSVEEVTSSATGSTTATDTRTRVSSATKYPYSATGMLLGEEGTSNE